MSNIERQAVFTAVYFIDLNASGKKQFTAVVIFFVCLHTWLIAVLLLNLIRLSSIAVSGQLVQVNKSRSGEWGANFSVV